MIVQIFELRCNDCNERFEDLFDFALTSHAEARAEAKKRGWVRRRDARTGDLQDFCTHCKGNH
jgi:hypothetical protein